MVNPQLVEYVRNTLAMGYGEPELRAFLISRGFAFQDVDEAFEQVQGAKPFGQLAQQEPQPGYQPQNYQAARPSQYAQPVQPSQPTGPQPYQPSYQAQPTYAAAPGYRQEQVLAQPQASRSASYSSTIKRRKPGLVLLFSFLTLGIYALYWLVTTTIEMRKLTLEAPDPVMWLLLVVPIGNLFVFYKYCKAVEALTGYSTTSLLLLFIFLPPVAQFVTQSKLNRIAD